MSDKSLHVLLIWSFLIGLLLPFTSAGQTTYFNPVDMLQGRKKASIPFRFVHNFIILDVQLYGWMQASLIFDTGAENIILFKKDYTDLVDAHYDKRIPIMGSDLSRPVYALLTRNAVISIGDLETRQIDILVLEEDYFNLEEMIGTPIAGLIGGGFFKDLIVEVDYKKYRITLTDPAHFQPPADHVALPVTIRTNKPYVNAEASLANGEVVQVDLLVDTGAGVPLLLHNNSHPSLSLPEHYIRGKLGMGLGGFLEGYIGRIKKLKVGSLEFPAVLTSFQDIQERWLEDKVRFRNGIVGNQLLSRFHVILDYGKGILYLKPYKSRQRPFDMDRSGLVILAYGEDFNRFVIRDILENSPALEADLHVGDEILKIQGVHGRLYTLDGINSILQKKAGKKIRMKIIRGNEVMRKTFVLRDLI